MTYEEFLQLRKEGMIVAGIDNDVAFRMIDYMPKHNRAAILFWTWITILIIPALIAVMILWKWWVGLITMLVVTPVVHKANKKSAADLILEQIDADKELFELLVSSDSLYFKETNAK